VRRSKFIFASAILMVLKFGRSQARGSTDRGGVVTRARGGRAGWIARVHGSLSQHRRRGRGRGIRRSGARRSAASPSCSAAVRRTAFAFDRRHSNPRSALYRDPICIAILGWRGAPAGAAKLCCHPAAVAVLLLLPTAAAAGEAASSGLNSLSSSSAGLHTPSRCPGGLLAAVRKWWLPPPLLLCCCHRCCCWRPAAGRWRRRAPATWTARSMGYVRQQANVNVTPNGRASSASGLPLCRDRRLQI
jgi:hypothetical protein